MAEKVRSALQTFGNSLIKIIIDQQENLGFEDTGESSASLRFEILPKSFKLFGSQAFGAMESGRGPGKAPPPDIMLAWVKRKNIIFDGLTQKSTAFVIGQMMAREGSAVFRGKRKGLNLTAIFQSTVSALIKPLEVAVAKDAAEEIKEVVKK